MSNSTDPMITSKTVVITGCTNGIGKETAAALASKPGFNVIMACRNLKLAEKVADEIRSRHPQANITVGPRLDLGSPDSIREFAEEYQKKGWPLHCLINNAGAVYQGEPYFTKNGIGGLCQVNYLGPFTLTRLLERQLIQSAPSRVVTVSSVTHRFSAIGPTDSFLTAWRQGSNYGNSKLGNVLFAFELHRRLAPYGVQSCAVDPGAVGSSIWKSSTLFSKPPLSWAINSLYAPNEDGAQAVIHAATVDWQEDAVEAYKINAKWNKNDGKDTGSAEYRTEDDVRLYARGLFAWPTVTSWRGVVTVPRSQRTTQEKIKDTAYGLTALVHSVADYPCRRFSLNDKMKKFFSKTSPVPAAPLAYDRDLAQKLWEVSCDAAGLSRSIPDTTTTQSLKKTATH